MPKADLNIDDELDSSTSDSSTDESGRSSDKDVDYKSKYIGLSRVNTRLTNENKQLKDKLANLSEEYEGKLAEATGSASDATKRIKELEQLQKAAEDRATKWEREATKAVTRTEKAAEISEKFPALANAFLRGDLKDISDFDKPEDFDAYLERMSKLAGFAQQQQEEDQQIDTEDVAPPRKPTPPGAGATRTGNGKGAKMTAQQIRDRLMELNPSNPKHQDEYDQLMDQLELV